MCYVCLLPLSLFIFVCSCVFLTTKPIYAQLDLLLRATIHVFMTGCLLRLSTLRIAVAFLINIKCAKHKGNNRDPQEKVSRRRSTHKANALPLILPRTLACPCLRVLWQDTHAPKDLRAHSLGRCFSFDLLVKKLKFYGLFFARLLSNKSGISIRCQR